MTPIELQRELAEETENILKDIMCKTVSGKPANIRAFCQSLPKQMQNITAGPLAAKEEGDDTYPFCVVRIDSGELEAVNGVMEIRTTLVFGIFDDDVSCQGHQIMLTMFQRIMERFAKNPVLNDRYQMNPAEGVEWTLDDEDRHPYYLGAMLMAWNTIFAGREEERYV